MDSTTPPLPARTATAAAPGQPGALPDTGDDPWPARLASIRQIVTAWTELGFSPADPRTALGDLLVEFDRQTELLAYTRTYNRHETLCYASELLHRVGLPQAAEVLDAQLLLEHVGQGSGSPLAPAMHDRILTGLARLPADEFPRDTTAQDLADARDSARGTLG